jgi:hypothetical protein
MSISSGPTLPALHGTLGSIEIGLVLGTFLFGLLTLQAFNYFRTSTNDTLLLKTLVGVPLAACSAPLFTRISGRSRLWP